MAVLKKRHPNMMKNIFYLVLILAFSLKGFGQTYTVAVDYSGSSGGCTSDYEVFSASFQWEFRTDNKSIDTYYAPFKGTESEWFTDTKVYPAVARSDNYHLILTTECSKGGSDANDNCSSNDNFSMTELNLLTGKLFNRVTGCNGAVGFVGFKPNVTIRKQNDPSSPTICSGFTLNLGGFPAEFPKVAYHWQYSFDGVSNWVDVRADKNDTPVTAFTIQDILGDSHVNHFGKQIYFRLGYGQDRPFTEPLAITYSSCAPVAEEVVYVPPRCNGDAVNTIEVYFDRELDEDKNENLYPIYVANKMDKTQQFFQPEYPVTSLVFDPIKKRYKYSFINLTTLVDGDSYVVVYQARIGEVPRGVLTTSSKGFTYKDPEKLEFVITKQTPPSCFGGEDGSIEIMVTSGVPLYRFYKDEVELKDQLYPTLKDGKYHILGLKANPDGYKIKVTDANGCIEKTTP
jgi:hypothetical protein